MPSQTGSIDLMAQVSANNNAKDYSDTVVDNLEIGGRNLLLNSKVPVPTLAPYSNSVTSKYNTPALDGIDYYYCSGTRYWRIDFPTLVSGETYNLWFDIARSADSRPVFVKIGSTEQNIGTALGRAWKRLGLSFVASTDTYAEIRVAIASTGTQNDYIAALRNVKLEKGDKATDWTPAPEDVDASISSAAQTATNYITADANGISIHMAGNSTTYQRQTSDSTTFYVGGKKRSQVGADGLKVYVGSTEIEMASFGTSTRIGKAYVEGATDNESHMELDFHSMRMVDKEGTEFFEVEDLRNRDGVYSVTETVTYQEPEEGSLVPAVIQQYDFPMRVTGFSVTLADNTNDTVNWTLHHTDSPSVHSYITRDDGSVYGDVTFYGETNSSNAKMLTFGTRDGVLLFGEGSVGMGNLVGASGRWSHAEGSETKAIGEISHAEGRQTIAYGNQAHAEGWSTKANGTQSHAEGFSSIATGQFSHAEGRNTNAYGDQSHAEGWDTDATGSTSHAEGNSTTASGLYSHTQNNHTVAAYEAQTAIGKWNYNDPNNAFEIGNGLGNVSSTYTNRTNAFAVGWDGTTTHYGDISWTNFPLSSTTAHYNSSKPLRYRKWGKMVNLLGAVVPKAQVAKEGVLTIGTLPDGCRPIGELVELCQGSGTASWMLRITTGGVVTAERYRNISGYQVMLPHTNGSGGAWLTLNCTFIVA